MVRKFTTPVELPADPTAALEAATKQYADTKAPSARTITAGTGLTGGGDLSADRTLAVSYGTSSGTAAQGNDSRLSDARTPTAHKTTHATGGSDVLTPSDIGAVPTTQRGPIGGVATPSYSATVTPVASTAVYHRYVATGPLTINAPSGGVDGQPLFIEVQASGASRTVTFDAVIELSGSAPVATSTVASGGKGTYLLRLLGSTWRLMHADPLNVAVAAPADVQVFTTAGTWTKPTGAATVHMVCIGGGGGGGGGARAPSGTAYSGGAGGGGGGMSWASHPASALDSTEPVGVGAAGTAGTAAASNTTAGGAGGNGGPSTVGPMNGHYKCIGFGGGGGGGGAAGTAAAGGAGSGILGGSAGGAGTAGAAGAVGGSPQTSGSGGGSGGGLAATQAALAGGNGGAPVQTQLTIATGGLASGTATGTAGNSVTTSSPMGGGGGGGGASRTSGAAGAGGAGGSYGAGGGGGGTAANGQTAGAGGAGAAGIVIVTSWS